MLKEKEGDTIVLHLLTIATMAQAKTSWPPGSSSYGSLSSLDESENSNLYLDIHNSVSSHSTSDNREPVQSSFHGFELMLGKGSKFYLCSSGTRQTNGRVIIHVYTFRQPSQMYADVTACFLLSA